MRDTAGQASALTGGYASSYAEGVGQQKYDEYLQQLGAIVPELYSIAYSRYQDEGDALRERYDLAAALRNREYKSYTDALDDYNDAQQRAYEREQADWNASRSSATASISAARTRQRPAQNTAISADTPRFTATRPQTR